MSDVIVNGKGVDVKLLEELNETIKTNNDIASKQNESLLRYTKWLYGLTVGIGIIAILQLFAMGISLYFLYFKR